MCIFFLLALHVATWARDARSGCLGWLSECASINAHVVHTEHNHETGLAINQKIPLSSSYQCLRWDQSISLRGVYPRNCYAASGSSVLATPTASNLLRSTRGKYLCFQRLIPTSKHCRSWIRMLQERARGTRGNQGGTAAHAARKRRLKRQRWQRGSTRTWRRSVAPSLRSFCSRTTRACGVASTSWTTPRSAILCGGPPDLRRPPRLGNTGNRMGRRVPGPSIPWPVVTRTFSSNPFVRAPIEGPAGRPVVATGRELRRPAVTAEIPQVTARAPLG